MIAGRLIEVRSDERTTATTAAVASGATAIPVDDVTPFGDDGGQVDIGGVVYDYTGVDTSAVNADGEGGVLLLASGLTSAVPEFTLLSELIGGAVAVDFYAVVDLGTDDEASHHVEVPIATRQERLAWPVQVYDPPLPVSLSDDLEQIMEAPGVQPEFIGIIRASEIVGSFVSTEGFYEGDTAYCYMDGSDMSSVSGTQRAGLAAIAYTGGPGNLYPGLVMTRNGTTFGRLIWDGSRVVVPQTFQANALATTGDLTADGALKSGAMALNGTNDTDFGARYCRVGPEGQLFASTTAPSSATVKHDIQDLDLDVDAILSMRPVTYRYNEMPDVVRVGLIAEEVDELGIKALVGYEDRDDPTRPTGLDYDGLGPALLLVVQRQQQKISALEKTVTDLAARLAKLEQTGGAA